MLLRSCGGVGKGLGVFQYDRQLLDGGAAA